jgi:hypothetical protein
MPAGPGEPEISAKGAELRTWTFAAHHLGEALAAEDPYGKLWIRTMVGMCS